MKKFLIIGFLLLGNILSAQDSDYSNSDYPKVLIIRGDTVICINKDQLYMTLIGLIRYRECEEEKQKYVEIVDKYDAVIYTRDSVIVYQQYLIEKKDEIIIYKDSLYYNLEQKSKLIIQQNDELNKKLRRSKFKIIAASVVSFILAILIF